MVLQTRQDDPLGPRHPVHARYLVGIGAHVARDVIEQDQEIVFEIGAHCPKNSIVVTRDPAGRAALVAGNIRKYA